jgi:hypothetical protein
MKRFNEAFGSPEELPFDLKHRRWPLSYHLAVDVPADERRTVRESLVKALGEALTAAADHVPTEEAEQAPGRLQSVPFGTFQLPSPQFIEDGRLVAYASPTVPGATADGKLYWHNAPHAYIDLRAAQATSTETYEQLRKRVEKPPFRLIAFGERRGSWVSRNSDGIVTGDVLADERHANAISITQLFKATGRLLGVNQAIVARVDNRAVLGGGRVRTDFISALKNYLEFYALNPDLPTPLQLHCGFEMLSDVYLATSDGGIDELNGPCVQSSLYHSVDQVMLDVDPHTLLRPLFVNLWDLMGVEYRD